MWSKQINANSESAMFPAAPDLVIVFGPTDRLADRTLIDRLAHRYDTAMIVGCSSGTMVEGDRLDDDGVVILGMGFDRT